MAACSIRHASTACPFSRVPIMRATEANTSASVGHRATPPALPRPPTGTCALTIHGPRLGKATGVAPVTTRPAGTAMPWAANSALPSASISSTSERPEAHDAVLHIEVADDLLADEVAQRFRGAAADGAVAGATVEAGDGEFVGEAEAAMHLNRLGGDPQRHLVAEDLRRGRHERIRERVGGHAGAVQQAAGGLDVLEHVRQLPPDPLK